MTVTGESLYPRDLIERLRGALDEREQIAMPAAERLYLAAMTSEVLRTIQAHRRLIDRHHTGPEQSPWTGDMTRRCVSCFQNAPCETVRDLASIYFPESDG